MTWRKKIKLPYIQRLRTPQPEIETTPEKAAGGFEGPRISHSKQAEHAREFLGSLIDSLFEIQHSINDLEVKIEETDQSPRQYDNALGNYDQLRSRRETLLSYVESTIIKNQ